MMVSDGHLRDFDLLKRQNIKRSFSFIALLLLVLLFAHH